MWWNNKARSIIELRTPGEIDAMAAAGTVVAACLRATSEAGLPGVTPLDLDAIAVDVIADRGAVSCYIGYHPAWAPSPYPAVTCISVNDTVVHAIPDRRPLEPGDLVSIDIAVTLDGWAADAAISFTVPGGGERPENDRLISTTKAALDAGIEQMRPGNRLGDVSAAIGAVARNPGYGLLAGHTGHGIGRQMHAPPDVPNEGTPHRGIRLRPGLVLAIEPMLHAGGGDGYRHHEDGWGVRTDDGSLAAHFEHTVAVTTDGPRILTAD
jgi:methionyl aminopeptidase